MSTTINSAQYTQLLTQLTSQFGYSNTEMSSYLNSIWGICSDVDGLANCENLSSSQKENIIMDLIQRGAGLVMGFFNQASKAKKETKESDSKIETELYKYGQQRDKTTAAIDEILDQIEKEDMKSIADALEKISALGDKGQLGEIKKQIEEKKAEIEACIKAISEAKEKDDLKTIVTNLSKIEGLRSQISTLISDVDTITATIEKENKTVADATIKLTEKQVKAETLLKEEIENATKSIAEESGEGAKNIVFTEKGTIEITTGEALEAQAAAGATAGALTFGISTALSAGVSEKAMDYINAGTTHLTEGGANLAKVGSALSEIGGGMADVSRYATTIGSVITNASMLVGDYYAESLELIVSIGTYTESVEGIMGDEGQLAKAVNTDLQTISDLVGTEENEINVPLANPGMNNDKSGSQKTNRDLLTNMSQHISDYTGSLTDEQKHKLELETLKIDIGNFGA